MCCYAGVTQPEPNMYRTPNGLIADVAVASQVDVGVWAIPLTQNGVVITHVQHAAENVAELTETCELFYERV